MTVLFAVLSQSQIEKSSIHEGYSRFINDTYHHHPSSADNRNQSNSGTPPTRMPTGIADFLLSQAT
jgi:hypothetical protein